MTYADAHALIQTARDQRAGKPLGSNTRLTVAWNNPQPARPSYAVHFYATDVITFTARGTMILNSGGYRTVTTARRINEYLPEGYRLDAWRLYRYQPDNPKLGTRRQRTYRTEQHFHAQPIHGEVPDPERCVCGAAEYEHRLPGNRNRPGPQGEDRSVKAPDVPGPCQAPSYMHVGYTDFGHVCDCPGFLSDPHAMKRAQIGETQIPYNRQIPAGWETVPYSDPHVKISDFEDSMEVNIKTGKVKVPPIMTAYKALPTRRVSQRQPILAWHCISADLETGHGGITVEAGKTYTVDGDPSICYHGLHASRRLRDALNYHRGPVVCRVEISGKVQEQDDKVCGTRRRVLWMVDASELTELVRRTVEYDGPDGSDRLEADVTKLAGQATP